MTTDQILEKILSNTFTKNDCFKKLAVLQDFLDTQSYGGESKGAALTAALKSRYENTDDRPVAEAVAAWGEEVIAFLMKESSHELQSIKSRVAALPELVLYLPTALHEDHVAALGAWCRDAVDAQVLLEIHVDSSSAGGCFFVWKDLFYDFSLSYFMLKRDTEIRAMLAHHEKTYVH